MKCEFCGGTLLLEDEKCPNCGQANMHARQHINDMRHYQGEFESTEKYVRNKAIIYSQICVRAIIIAVLSVLTIIMFIMAAKAWDIQREYKRYLTNKNFNEYSAQLNRLIENGEYLAVRSYANAKMIRRYDSPYEIYRPYLDSCDSYAQVFESVQEFIAFNDPDISMDYACEMFGSSMDRFYKRYADKDNKYTNNGYQPETYLKMMDSMKEEIELMLKTYCGFTEQELEDLSNNSKVQKQALFEEKLTHKMKGVRKE